MIEGTHEVGRRKQCGRRWRSSGIQKTTSITPPYQERPSPKIRVGSSFRTRSTELSYTPPPPLSKPQSRQLHAPRLSKAKPSKAKCERTCAKVGSQAKCEHHPRKRPSPRTKTAFMQRKSEMGKKRADTTYVPRVRVVKSFVTFPLASRSDTVPYFYPRTYPSQLSASFITSQTPSYPAPYHLSQPDAPHPVPP